MFIPLNTVVLLKKESNKKYFKFYRKNVIFFSHIYYNKLLKNVKCLVNYH